ncbi:hypothetical protein FIBSPDRAFT_317833 [Athelia psychrophila]|uniref:Uncharacterized protein n=1 Tax=Athelia psychrophila TaxID=1759441 RepID=A0A167WVB7_9AGAM|nr:hypothetical protein FIBSPDRAFT_317833 [Fibularhizoctonia sp. CBS 109695]
MRRGSRRSRIEIDCTTCHWPNPSARCRSTDGWELIDIHASYIGILPGQMRVAKIGQEIDGWSRYVGPSHPPPSTMIHDCGKLTLFHLTGILNPPSTSDALLTAKTEVHIGPTLRTCKKPGPALASTESPLGPSYNTPAS